MKKKILVGLVVVVMILGMCVVAIATSYDAFYDFNAITNTTGNTWQYGYKYNLGGTFNLYNKKYTGVSGLEWWTSSFYFERDPGVSKNITGKDFVAIDGDILFPGSNFLHFHPGFSNEFSIIRWVAPTASDYQITSVFKSLRMIIPTTTDVHVLYNSTSIYDSIINGVITSGDEEFKTSMFLNAGDIIDFAVGFGTNKNFFYDSTGLQASINTGTAPVPEPATMLLLATGIAWLAGIRFRKKKQ